MAVLSNRPFSFSYIHFSEKGGNFRHILVDGKAILIQRLTIYPDAQGGLTGIDIYPRAAG